MSEERDMLRWGIENSQKVLGKEDNGIGMYESNLKTSERRFKFGFSSYLAAIKRVHSDNRQVGRLEKGIQSYPPIDAYKTEIPAC